LFYFFLIFWNHFQRNFEFSFEFWNKPLNTKTQTQ
jgi:hypothetical protein